MTAYTDSSRLAFPEGFTWGISTSAHQFEGGNDANNWSAWERRGRIHTGEVSGLACDWWANAEKDFDLARSLGIRGLRLSLEWSRLEPREGDFDEAAVLRYRAMIEALIARGIKPMVCLHHFTNPLWFEARGAFLADDAVETFARFATRVVDAFGDLVNDFITFNEPNVYAVQGYIIGVFPPGRVGDILSARKVMIAMTRAHAAAYRAMKAKKPGLHIGFTQNVIRFAPKNPRALGDRAIARGHEASFDDAMIHAIMGGELSMLSRPFVPDPVEVSGTTDFLGINYYSRLHVAFDPRQPKALFGHVFVPEDAMQGDLATMGPYGECDPEGLAYFVRRYASLGKPIHILENGVPDRDDRVRPWFIAETARVLHGLIAEGHDIRGYYHWSLVDNFEWCEGWLLRFGLVGLDPDTQVRTMRDSGRLYGAIATKNALCAEDVAKYAPTPRAGLFPERRLR